MNAPKDSYIIKDFDNGTLTPIAYFFFPFYLRVFITMYAHLGCYTIEGNAISLYFVG